MDIADGSGDFALSRYEVPIAPDYAIGFNTTELQVNARSKRSNSGKRVSQRGFDGIVMMTSRSIPRR
jgi:hypothetical protein